MKLLDLKNDKHRTMDTYMDTKALQLKVRLSAIRWYQWRTSRDTNPEPTDQKTDVLGKQGQTATNMDNKINMIKGKIYQGIFRNMAGFCKLVAQNWHKNSPLVRACSDFTWRVSDCEELVGVKVTIL